MLSYDPMEFPVNTEAILVPTLLQHEVMTRYNSSRSLVISVHCILKHNTKKKADYLCLHYPCEIKAYFADAVF